MMTDSTYHDDTYNPETIPYNAGDYQDANAEILPLPANYEFRVTAFSRKKGKDGVEISEDGWPVITIQRVEIVEPLEESGTFAVFQDIKTKPFQRRARGGRKVWASRAADLLRAIDREIEVADYAEAYEELERLFSEGRTFRAGTGLNAQDNEYLKAELSKLSPEDKEARNKVFNTAKLTTKAFRNPDGSYRLQAEGPSGRTLKARLVLASFIPSDENVHLGQKSRELVSA